MQHFKIIYISVEKLGSLIMGVCGIMAVWIGRVTTVHPVFSCFDLWYELVYWVIYIFAATEVSFHNHSNKTTFQPFNPSLQKPHCPDLVWLFFLYENSGEVWSSHIFSLLKRFFLVYQKWVCLYFVYGDRICIFSMLIYFFCVFFTWVYS